MIDAPAYERCPKCLHAPLPPDQRLPAACPACGVILAKAAAPGQNEADALSTPDAESRFGLMRRLHDALVFIPAEVKPGVWWSRVALLLLFAVWGLRLIAMDYRDGELGGSFLHGPLLIFHEAGHFIASPLGEFITVLGGALGQLLMPAIIVAAFLRQHDPFGAAIATWLFGVSVLDLAPYVYDALDPQLVLLGGHTGADGGHDFIYLLGEIGLLHRAHGLGAFTHTLGALFVALSVSWGAWLLMKQRAREQAG